MASASAWPRAPPARVALGPSWGAALRPGTCPRGVPAPAAKKRGRRTAEGGSPRLDTLSVDQLRHAVKTIAGDLEEVYSDADRIEAADARGLSAAELARERLLCTRLAGLALARTRISSAGAVAGMGVFAARDIGAGELITCYPGDALVSQGPDDGEEEQAQDVIFGPHVHPDLAVPTDCFERLVDYGIEVDDSYVVIGIPELALDAAYCGHFVNDGAMLQGADEDSIHRVCVCVSVCVCVCVCVGL